MGLVLKSFTTLLAFVLVAFEDKFVCEVNFSDGMDMG